MPVPRAARQAVRLRQRRRRRQVSHFHLYSFLGPYIKSCVQGRPCVGANDCDKREARATSERARIPPPLRLSRAGRAGRAGRLSGVADDGGGAGLLETEVEALLKVLRLNHRRLVLAATHTPYPPPPTPLHTQPRPPHPILSPAHPIHTQPRPPLPLPLPLLRLAHAIWPTMTDHPARCSCRRSKEYKP